MTDDPQKPRVRKRVETALKEKDSATRMRRWADELSEADPTGARWTRKDADAIEAKAEIALSRSSYTTDLPETGNGGELVPLPESQTFAIAEAVREPPDMLAHSASTQRMELAAEADVLTLGLDAANSIDTRDSIEQMLMHQAAAAHKLGMRFLAKADHQLSQVDTWNPGSYQAHSVEAARLAHAAGKLMSAFSDTVLTVQRRRSGGKQVVQVIHQQVAVGAGGKAIVAGTVKEGRKAGPKLRGPR
jgi:hypothetical protein